MCSSFAKNRLNFLHRSLTELNVLLLNVENCPYEFFFYFESIKEISDKTEFPEISTPYFTTG